MAYTIDSGLLESDISTILATRYQDPTAIKYRLVIHTPIQDIVITELASVELLRDYRNNIADFVLTTHLMPMGDFKTDILPHLDHLEASLTLLYYDRSIVTRYRMVLNNNLGNLQGTMYTTMTRTQLNELELIKVESQLIHITVEALRTIQISGIYGNQTVTDLIYGKLKEAIATITIQGEQPVVNINMIEASNQRDHNHIVIPVGTKLLDLPSLLQEGDYGVYSSGIGIYFQPYDITTKGVKDSDTIFVYPLSDPTQFDNQVKKLMIISTPTHKYTYADHTYLVDGDVIKIIGTASVKGSESGDNELISGGDGLIVGDINTLSNGNKRVTETSVSSLSTENLTGEKIKDKRDGVINANYVGYTNNPFKHYSEVAARNLDTYSITWRHCNVELLYPGMPVSFIYEDATRGIVKLTGLLQSVFAKHDAASSVTSAIINIVVTKSIDVDTNIEVINFD